MGPQRVLVLEGAQQRLLDDLLGFVRVEQAAYGEALQPRGGLAQGVVEVDDVLGGVRQRRHEAEWCGGERDGRRGELVRARLTGYGGCVREVRCRRHLRLFRGCAGGRTRNGSTRSREKSRAPL